MRVQIVYYGEGSETCVRVACYGKGARFSFAACEIDGTDTEGSVEPKIDSHPYWIPKI